MTTDLGHPVSSGVVVPMVDDHRIALRECFGARAVGGSSAILAAVAFILHGNPVDNRGARAEIDPGVVRRSASAGHHDAPEATHGQAHQCGASPLNDASDRQVDDAIPLTGEA